METKAVLNVDLDAKALQQLAVDALDDIKGRDIEVIDTRPLSTLFDSIVVASGDSNRHVRSLAHNVAEKVRDAGGRVLSVEGESGGEWVLVDLGAVVVHVMQPAVRIHYSLEDLWTSTPATRQRIVNGKPGKPGG